MGGKESNPATALKWSKPVTPQFSPCLGTRAGPDAAATGGTKGTMEHFCAESHISRAYNSLPPSLRIFLNVTFEILQLFGFCPARFLCLGIIIVGLSRIGFILFPGTLGQQLLMDRKTKQDIKSKLWWCLKTERIARSEPQIQHQEIT